MNSLKLYEEYIKEAIKIHTWKENELSAIGIKDEMEYSYSPWDIDKEREIKETFKIKDNKLKLKFEKYKANFEEDYENVIEKRRINNYIKDNCSVIKYLSLKHGLKYYTSSLLHAGKNIKEVL